MTQPESATAADGFRYSSANIYGFTPALTGVGPKGFGHGKRHLASVLATLNLLAFAIHTVCDLGDRAWKAARRELVVRQGFFQTLSSLTAYVVFASWQELLEAMAFARPMPQGP